MFKSVNAINVNQILVSKIRRDGHYPHTPGMTAQLFVQVHLFEILNILD